MASICITHYLLPLGKLNLPPHYNYYDAITVFYFVSIIIKLFLFQAIGLLFPDSLPHRAGGSEQVAVWFLISGVKPGHPGLIHYMDKTTGSDKAQLSIYLDIWMCTEGNVKSCFSRCQMTRQTQHLKHVTKTETATSCSSNA